MSLRDDEAEMTVLVRAGAEIAGNSESVYCAGVLADGSWVRLIAPSFRDPGEAIQLKRWDRVRFRWRAAPGDARPESRLVLPHSMAIIGEMLQDDRGEFTRPLETTSLKRAQAAGQSLALLRPAEPKFLTQRKSQTELDADHLASKTGPKPFPYKFRYSFSTDEGPQEATYQDAEMNAMLANLAKSFGEAQTVSRIMKVYGKDYPQKGMLFVMSRQPQPAAPWLICGILCMDEIDRLDLPSLDLVV